MTAPGAWGALPPEENSAGFWLGPGAESFIAAAENLVAVASGLIANLGGQQAVNAALAASWPDPTGEQAVLSKVPLMLWQALAAGQISEASAAIHATALAFETLKAATPTPLEIGENQTEHGVLQANNFLGMLTPLIGINRANYGRMWVTAASNKYSYAAASATGVQSIPPLPPPPPATEGAASMPSMPPPNSNKAEDLASSPEQALQAFMGPLQQVGSMGSQLGSGGPLSSVGQMGQSAFGPLTQMLQSGMGGNTTDALASSMSADWLSATPGAGGPVAANLVSGMGGAGGGGGGGLGGLSAFRGPTGFASAPTINAATANPEATVSRVTEARMASGAPASTAGMGSSGAMMGPMAARGAEQDKQDAGKERRSTPLASLASLYRAPAAVPVITGGSGAVFRGEEGITRPT
ncbi:PPE domain-containing protein [Mycobacteroides abscessus]|uniref:PPE domain-containing protein n=1 Tax=Mycobacteroides abscessus TaxID=36809 RepID=UPI0009A71C77|nr:PPE domain-containing protein [Mycobacteroides abscessus]SLJ76067.1 PPE-repeat containing protein [Mycobacteroides abscessus subsp. abscessus]SLJ80503.1 PPE-repeat containing protein [Mycobacteroides abscessus subsp. abscessus]